MPVEATPPPTITIQDSDARETRERLEELVKKLPPAVGRVLRTDPSLLSNEAYLSTYPSLATFLKQHPEVRSSPGFFFEQIAGPDFYTPRAYSPQEATVNMWRELFQGISIATVFLVITAGLIWIIRTLVDYRRWQRASKIHTEVHNKLLDRFNTNQDLLAYMETPAGRSFLEATPLTIDTPARPMAAPFTRILWSVQVGLVLMAGAVGLLFISGRVQEEIAQPFYAFGVLALTVGVGFVASAAASFLLSRRLGLLDPAVRARHTDTAPNPGS